MRRELQGYYIPNTATEEHFRSFVPTTLPPNPPILWTENLRGKFDTALVALGRLDSVSLLLPDTSLFIYMYVRKEAVLSSMIEGTQSSLSDLLLSELEQVTGVPENDVKDVCNYVAALDHGIKRLKEGVPFSNRLLKEIHRVLLSSGRGADQCPGEFRASPNWIGGTRPGNAMFVPPPPDYILECMGELELFLHDQKQETTILPKIAMAHAQFETIHPFLDGNGRLGRLMIPLLLYSNGIMREPMLYISYYFKSHRQQYYDLLNETRLTGDWEAWLEFFAEAVLFTANQSLDTASRLLKLMSNDTIRLNSLLKRSGSLHTIYKCMTNRPFMTAKRLREQTNLSTPTINSCLDTLSELGIIEEVTDRRRDRVYSYGEYIKIISEGTELPTQ